MHADRWNRAPAERLFRGSCDSGDLHDLFCGRWNLRLLPQLLGVTHKLPDGYSGCGFHRSHQLDWESGRICWSLSGGVFEQADGLLHKWNAVPGVVCNTRRSHDSLASRREENWGMRGLSPRSPISVLDVEDIGVGLDLVGIVGVDCGLHRRNLRIIHAAPPSSISVGYSGPNEDT